MRKDLRDNPRGLPQTTFPPSEPRRPGRRTAVPARPFALARSRQPPGTGAPHAPALPPAERSGVGDEDRERPRGFRGGRLGCPARAASEGAGPLPPLALSRLSPIASRPEPTRSSRPTALLTALLARDLVSPGWRRPSDLCLPSEGRPVACSLSRLAVRGTHTTLRPGLLSPLLSRSVMILPQVHLRKPCYDFYFL